MEALWVSFSGVYLKTFWNLSLLTILLFCCTEQNYGPQRNDQPMYPCSGTMMSPTPRSHGGMVMGTIGNWSLAFLSGIDLWTLLKPSSSPGLILSNSVAQWATSVSWRLSYAHHLIITANYLGVFGKQKPFTRNCRRERFLRWCLTLTRRRKNTTIFRIWLKTKF